VSKFLGFLLGAVVALVGPAVFGVLAADGGIKLNSKEMALAYGIGALVFWAVVSYFSGAGALGAAVAFGVMIYAVHWIPNRMTNFLDGVPGVTTGMIEGVKQYTLNGVVPILAVISLVYGIQLIVRAVQRRRRERAEAERLQREQEAAQAQQEADAAAAYPAASGEYPAAGAGAGYQVAGGDYPTSVDNRFGNRSGTTNYDDLFDEDPTPYPPREQPDERADERAYERADEQTAQYAGADLDAAADDDRRAQADDETVLVPTDRDETVQIPAGSSADEITAHEPSQQAAEKSVAEGTDHADDETQVSPAAPPASVGPTSGTPSSAAPSGATPSSSTPPSSTPPPPAPPSSTAPPSAAPSAPTAPPETGGSSAHTEPAGPDSTQSPAAPKPGAQAPEGRTGQEFGRNEEVGQQYRERMDGPEVNTGEHHFGAFENPSRPDEGLPQAPRVMDLPGQFRPAGA
jgi:hypothetical protein